MKWEKITAGLYQWDDYRIRRMWDEWQVYYKGAVVSVTRLLRVAKQIAADDFKKRLEAYNAAPTNESQVQA